MWVTHMATYPPAHPPTPPAHPYTQHYTPNNPTPDAKSTAPFTGVHPHTNPRPAYAQPWGDGMGRQAAASHTIPDTHVRGGPPDQLHHSRPVSAPQQSSPYAQQQPQRPPFLLVLRAPQRDDQSIAREPAKHRTDARTLAPHAKQTLSRVKMPDPGAPSVASTPRSTPPFQNPPTPTNNIPLALGGASKGQIWTHHFCSFTAISLITVLYELLEFSGP